MTRSKPPEHAGPLFRPLDVMNLPPQGQQALVEASEDERSAIAKEFGLPAIHSLVGDYKLQKTAKGVHVKGMVKASFSQICVVTLEPFDSAIEEMVEVDFAEAAGMPAEPPNEMHDYEPPDEIVNGHIDLGALTAEFLALGLDPYPRKPGVDFEYRNEDDKESPFAALGRLKEGP